MSKHHHHPHEGHGTGNPPGSSAGHLRHNWFFYVAGFFLMLALIGFILEGTPSMRPGPVQPPPAPSGDGTGK